MQEKERALSSASGRKETWSNHGETIRHGPWHSPRPSLPTVYNCTSQSPSCVCEAPKDPAPPPLSLSCVLACPFCLASQLAPQPSNAKAPPTPGPLHMSLHCSDLYWNVCTAPSLPLQSLFQGLGYQSAPSPSSVNKAHWSPAILCMSRDSQGGRAEDSSLKP